MFISKLRFNKTKYPTIQKPNDEASQLAAVL